MITDTIKNWMTYPYGDVWRQVFSFIGKLDTNSRVGEYEILGDDIFARVMEYETREKDAGVLESHRKYIDIQTTLAGAEGMFYVPIDHLSIKTPYDDQKDVVFYHYPTSFPSKIDIYPGHFIVFFPHDAHMPQMVVGQKSLIKKAVVKIKADLLT